MPRLPAVAHRVAVLWWLIDPLFTTRAHVPLFTVILLLCVPDAMAHSLEGEIVGGAKCRSHRAGR